MKIAVTSQNRKSVTEHAGRCRKFWIFLIENESVVDKKLLELSKEQSFHESSPHDDHPLDDVDVLIAGGMGQGLMRRLRRKNIDCLITSEEQPDKAVSLYLRGALENEKACRHSHSHCS